MNRFAVLFALLVLALLISAPCQASCPPGITFTPHYTGYGHVGGNLLVVPSNEVFVPRGFVGVQSFGSPSVTIDVNGFRAGHFGSRGFARRGRNLTIIESGGVRTFVFR